MDVENSNVPAEENANSNFASSELSSELFLELLTWTQVKIRFASMFGMVGMTYL